MNRDKFILLLKSFLIYFLGAISLIILDVFISKNYPNHLITEWGEVKSFIMIFGSLILLGANSMLIRFKNEHIKIFNFAFVSSICVSILIFIVLAIIKNTEESLVIVFCTFFYGFLLLIASYKRSQLKISQAQFHQNFWKILLLLTMVAMFFIFKSVISIRPTLLVTLLLAVIILLVMHISLLKINKGLFSVKTFFKRSNYPSKSIISFGLKFVISLLTASSSAYLEVLLISNNSQVEVSSLYFTHYVIFTATATFVSGFIGFILTPLIRANPKKWAGIIMQNKVVLICLCLISSFLYGYLASLAFNLIFDKELIFPLAVILTLISAIRVIYIIPSSVLGALSNTDELNGFLWSGLFGVFFMVCIFYMGLEFDVSVMILIAIASLINWIIRSGSAFFYASKIYSKLNFR